MVLSALTLEGIEGISISKDSPSYFHFHTLTCELVIRIDKQDKNKTESGSSEVDNRLSVERVINLLHITSYNTILRELK